MFIFRFVWSMCRWELGTKITHYFRTRLFWHFLSTGILLNEIGSISVFTYICKLGIYNYFILLINCPLYFFNCPLYIHWPSLYLLASFGLKSALSDIRTDAQVYLPLLFASQIVFQPLTLNLQTYLLVWYCYFSTKEKFDLFLRQ